ncbi:hypothetical protein PFISCL1PPCAC_9807, partial [Pristionchus fissidentatus]
QKLLVMYHERPEGVDSPLRKYIWAAAVRHDGKFVEVQDVLSREIDQVRGALTPYEMRFGTRAEDLVYALCATYDRKRIEFFFSYMMKEPFYKGKHIVAAFTSMLEDGIDECNYSTARFFLTGRHHHIRAKMHLSSANYRRIFEMTYRFAMHNPAHEDWLSFFVSSGDAFTDAEKKKLDLAGATTYAEYYVKKPGRDAIVEKLLINKLQKKCAKEVEEKLQIKKLTNSII